MAKHANNLPAYVEEHDSGVAEQKLSFPLKISSVNVTKSARNSRFGHIY